MINRSSICAFVIGVVAASSVQVVAQQHAMQQKSGMDTGAMQIHQAMMSSAKQMMNMKMPMERDTDRMFDRMMADHHASGIKMAQIELKFGDDPASKQMAKHILSAQQQEKQQLLALATKAK